mgnify:FL=1
MNVVFVLNSILLGAGLAMDAFSVSIANGLNEPHMSRSKMCWVAGTYAGYQFAMPMIGWFCVHAVAEQFEAFRKFIPWIALLLLALIGGKMLAEGIRSVRSGKSAEAEEAQRKQEACLGFGTLMVQGIATSIDALSVGFTISVYGTMMAAVCSFLIAVTTFVLCMAGLKFGKKFGERLADKATIFGGLLLIAIGVEIFVKGVL